MAYGDPTGVNKILVEKYGYEWVNGKAWRPGTAPEPESPTIEVTQGPLPDWITPPPADALVTQALETLTNPITGEEFTVPSGGYTVNVPASEDGEAPSTEPTIPVATTPEADPVSLEPISLEERIEQLQASLNELQKKYEKALEKLVQTSAKLEQANARIAELEGQKSDASNDVSYPDDASVLPDEIATPEPQKPSEADAEKTETPEVTTSEPTPVTIYPEPTGVDKILVEKYGYEWVNGKAWKPGTAPKSEAPSSDASEIPVETVIIPQIPPETTQHQYISFKVLGDPVIDALTQGSYWQTGPNDNLTFAVAGGLNGETWIDEDLVGESLQKAMQQLTKYTNANVEYLGYFENAVDANTNGAEIVLSLDGEGVFFDSLDQWAIGFFPNDTAKIYDNLAGDMYLNVNSAANYLPSYEPGSTGWKLLLHELGHALGLKHPHDSAGGRPTLNEVDLGRYDSDVYTVMSYNDFGFDDTKYSPADFMIGDVIALQYLYGKNETSHDGDTVHQIKQTDLYETIWDANGNDSVYLPNGDWLVFLPYINHSSLSYEYIGSVENYANSYSSEVTSLSWLLGDIENAYGGGGDDELHGNQSENILSGGAGNDYLSGWEADDILIGGPGIDTFVLREGSGKDVIKDFQIGVDRLKFLDNNGDELDPEFVALGNNGRGDIVYTIDDGSQLVLEGVAEINNFWHMPKSFFINEIDVYTSNTWDPTQTVFTYSFPDNLSLLSPDATEYYLLQSEKDQISNIIETWDALIPKLEFNYLENDPNADLTFNFVSAPPVTSGLRSWFYDTDTNHFESMTAEIEVTGDNDYFENVIHSFVIETFATGTFKQSSEYASESILVQPFTTNPDYTPSDYDVAMVNALIA